MPLSLDAVLALSPDESSTKAARGLLAPAKWPTLGADEHAVWGECQGSGSKPYQTQVDLRGGTTAFRCTCPSRKFPCKHGLALLMLHAQGHAKFGAGPPPAWVAEWLQSRSERAQKKAETLTALVDAASKLAEPAPGVSDVDAAAASASASASAATAAETVSTPASADKTDANQERRWKSIETGAEELQRWLGDLMRQGLGSAQATLAAQALQLAARLVDAKAQGLAARLRELAEAAQAREAAPRMLQRLGGLQLLCDAVARRRQLPADALADLRYALGWTQDKAELVATQARVLDGPWRVLGQIQQERENNLRERRVWLQDVGSQAVYLLTEHVHAVYGGGFSNYWPSGAVVQRRLLIQPGALAWRVIDLALSQDAAAGGEQGDASHHTPSANSRPASFTTRNSLAQRLALNPWRTLEPVQLGSVWLVHEAGGQASAERFFVQLVQEGEVGDAREAAPRRLPLVCSDEDAASLLALSAGRPVDLMGEWNGFALRPLAARLVAPAAHEEAAWWCDRLLSNAVAPAELPVQPHWAALLPVVMVGVDRMALPTLHWPEPVRAQLAPLLQQLAHQAGDPALTLLRTLGVLAVCERAGQQGQLVPAGTQLPAAAPADPRPLLPESALPGDLLAHVLKDATPHQTATLLHTLAQRGWCLPVRQLIGLMNLGRRSTAIRPWLLPLAGERGRWLAQRFPAWNWAASNVAAQADAQTLWAEGSLAQRLNVLREERQHNPDAARERLTTALPELPASERAELLGALAVRLGPADEDLLNRLTQDRAKDVRDTARRLLLRLPASAFTQRTSQRVAVLMKQEAAGLLGLVGLKKRWVIEAPEAPGPDWKADDIPTARPKHERLGERAWWLAKLVALVPPAWWREHTGLNGAALLAWARQSDWADALLLGWYQALQAVPDIELAQALLLDWPPALASQPQAPLLAELPFDALVPLWVQLLQKGEALPCRLPHVGGKTPPLLVLLPQVMAALQPGQTMPAALAQALVEALPDAAKALGDVAYYWQSVTGVNWFEQLGDLSCHLSNAQIDRMMSLLAPYPAVTSAVSLLNAVAMSRCLNTLPSANLAPNPEPNKV